ncbi:MAG: hypothetical protein Kow0075_07230 [Salibacteraceae bacterium]
MMRLFHLLYLTSLLLLSVRAAGQQSGDLIQLSGVVVSGDSLSPVPFTSVIIKGSHRGTICDYYGFFTLVVRKGDTLQFSSVGYRDAETFVSDTLSENRYSMIQMLQRDTIELDEAVIYPWPSKEQFKQAFLSLNAPVDDYDRAFENLTREDVRLAIQGVPMSARGNHTFVTQQEYARLYSRGKLPEITLLNPLAWAQFIEAWKKGQFKTNK